MKKVIYTAVVLMLGMISMVSCKRVYHCNCSFNNKVVFSKDLGAQHQDDAEATCKGFDTTITGEVWNCSLY
jgi:hypothetical protein